MASDCGVFSTKDPGRDGKEIFYLPLFPSNLPSQISPLACLSGILRCSSNLADIKTARPSRIRGRPQGTEGPEITAVTYMQC